MQLRSLWKLEDNQVANMLCTCTVLNLKPIVPQKNQTRSQKSAGDNMIRTPILKWLCQVAGLRLAPTKGPTQYYEHLWGLSRSEKQNPNQDKKQNKHIH